MGVGGEGWGGWGEWGGKGREERLNYTQMVPFKIIKVIDFYNF